MKRYKIWSLSLDELADPEGDLVKYEPWMDKAKEMADAGFNFLTAALAADDRPRYGLSMIDSSESKPPTICAECKSYEETPHSEQIKGICTNRKPNDIEIHSRLHSSARIGNFGCIKNHGNCPDFEPK